MNNLPAQWFQQQSKARPISGEHLELLGKKASAMWASGQARDLNEAVVETVKHAGLSPEQVQRVVEFTNVSAYLGEFKKEDAEHKVVDFGKGGPASTGEILRDLNDGGGGATYDSSTHDYDIPPEETHKTSAADEELLFKLLGASGQVYPEYNPFGDCVSMRDKLAGTYEHLTAELSALETEYADITNAIFEEVKQACAQGHSLGEVVQVWGGVREDPEYVKCAFASISGGLVENGVFQSYGELGASLEKLGSARVPNPQHPLVVLYDSYCDCLDKLASTRALREEVGVGVGQLTGFLAKYAFEPGHGLLHHAGNVGQKIVGGAGKLLLGNKPEHTEIHKLLDWGGRRAGQGLALGMPLVIGHSALQGLAQTNPIGGALTSPIATVQGLGMRVGAALPGGYDAGGGGYY